MSGRHIIAGRALDNVRDALGEIINGLLSESDVTDIYLNDPHPGEVDGTIWTRRLGRPSEPVGKMSAHQAMNLIGYIASSMGTVVTEDSPAVEGFLITDGCRFMGSAPPIKKFPTFSIRKHSSIVIPFRKWMEEKRVTSAQERSIRTAIEQRKNIVIAASTGAGKTTFANTLIDEGVEIFPERRWLILEDNPELKCRAMDREFFLTSRTMDYRALLRIAMRSNPDVVVIGEARGPEMLDILMAWNTGHEGSIATIHSNVGKPQAALDRIDTMLMLANPNPLHKLVAQAVNMIIYLERDRSGFRRVTQVVSVRGHDGQSYQLTSES